MSNPAAWPPVAYPETPTEFRPTLRDRTFTALRAHIERTKEHHAHIAERSGVTHGWLKMFATGKIPNPTVENIERLYYYLTGRVL